VHMNSGRQMTFSGADLFSSYSGDVPPRDAFDRWAVQRDAREDNSRSAQYVSRDMTGYEELDDNGDWHDVADYGPVWVPRVTARDWAPYHDGHWAWVAPWGWTWVDDEHWGFAPFHYGRWAHIDNYWAWVPGPIAPRPVYAPALVGFVGGGGGGGGGTHWGVSLSVGVPGVAWFALAPGEHYRPAYTSNPTYINNINRTVVVNKTVINENVYINQRVPNAIAAMPATAFVRGQGAHEHAQEIHEDRLKEFSKMPVASSLPVAPVRQSLAGEVREGHTPQAAPPARAQDHAVVIRHQAPEAPALHDKLARKFADQQGTVPGAGPVFTPIARPAPSPAPQGPNGRRGDADDRSARPASVPSVVAPAPAAANRPDPSRQGATPDLPHAPAPPSGSLNTARERGRDAPGETPRLPAAQQALPVTPRSEPVRPVEPPVQGNPEKRSPPPEAPRPPAREDRQIAPERARDDDRSRQERQQRDRPAEQAPVARPAPSVAPLPAPAPVQQAAPRPPAQAAQPDRREPREAPRAPHSEERPQREEPQAEHGKPPGHDKDKKPREEDGRHRPDDPRP
jgi:hypothetical protein